ncbi:Dynein regulatory complex protein 9 [Merluccius polli]|uniref:Dynein regulatory complex protein 9 n=1 Tax=Merluccius polli TaxID=89951 RepID=A0AA47N461_MERPO|nr:Dynein regulatory complex protein 9 [Merluccius polli]
MRSCLWQVGPRTNQKQGQWLEDHLAKVDRDRQYVRQVLSRVVCELRERQVYCSLLQEVKEEAESKAALHDVITRAEDGFRMTDQLQKHLQDVHQQSSLDLERREELAALLQDRLQEVQVRTSGERRYVSCSGQLLLFQTNKLHSSAQKNLETRTALLMTQLEEERRSHQESVNFLKEQQGLLGDRLEELMRRYEEVVEEKQEELSSLKTSRTQNLQLLQQLAQKYRHSEQVVIEDRVEKENLRRRREEEELQRHAATMIQAWWRGCMVRRGPLSRGKESKKKKKKKKTT